MNLKDIANIIFIERNRQKLSRNKLAELSGVSRGTIYDIEMSRCSPTITVLFSIFSVLNLEIRANHKEN
jgi:DNA-binding XRE family transcriptional regulator